jgi:hypothetical protein
METFGISPNSENLRKSQKIRKSENQKMEHFMLNMKGEA